jgi:cellobiose-specific phosphotransferase system component IIB
MIKDEIQAALYALRGIDEMLMGRENPQHIYYIETIRAALQSAQIKVETVDWSEYKEQYMKDASSKAYFTLDGPNKSDDWKHGWNAAINITRKTK